MHELQPLYSITEVSSEDMLGFYLSAGEKIDPRAHHCRCYCVFVDGFPVAGAVVLLDTPLRRWRIERRADVVSSVLTLPDYRKRGLARALMQHIITAHSELYLSVMVDNTEARNLYESLGFFHYKNGEGRVIMKYDEGLRVGTPDTQSPQNDLMALAGVPDVRLAVSTDLPMARRHPGYGYVSVKMNPRQATTLYEELVRIGLSKPLLPHKYHATLMYDVSNPHKHISRDQHRVFRAFLTDYDVLGTGKWRAVVIHLQSDHLDQRHQELKDLGFTHSYPDYKCHLSLRYTPSEADVNVVKEGLAHIKDLFAEGILFERETWEPIEED